MTTISVTLLNVLTGNGDFWKLFRMRSYYVTSFKIVCYVILIDFSTLEGSIYP